MSWISTSVRLAAAVATIACARFAPAQEVLIYTGVTQWIEKISADEQAQICADKLTALGIENTWYPTGEVDALADWVINKTNNGELDVLVLYGELPYTIYPDGNGAPDDSPAELFIESTDGDAIVNQGEYMFWAANGSNAEGGLENMMDIPGIVMWDDNTLVTVTDDGKLIAPSLTDFLTDRPFHLDQLANDWVVEKVLAQNAAGTRADPVILRDGNRGRLIPIYQAAYELNPKGAVAAEVIAWLYGKQLGPPSKLGVTGVQSTLAGRPARLEVRIEEATGSAARRKEPTVVQLTKDHATGAFDVSAGGAFDGAVTSVVIAPGETTATFFFRDGAAGQQVITATAGALTPASQKVKVFAETHAPPGEVAIETITSAGISQSVAQAQAQLCFDELTLAGVPVSQYSAESDHDALARWVNDSTGNGKLDVLLIYGDIPDILYSHGNAQPDDSLAEKFIESTDGDAIISQGDYMFWGANFENGRGGLQNVMDLPLISMWFDGTVLEATSEGREISPSLSSGISEGWMLHTRELSGDWHVERSLAEDTIGNADPVIVRDGERGRLIPALMVPDQSGSMGPVSFELIAWLLGLKLAPAARIGLAAYASTTAGAPAAVRVRLEDAAGSARRAAAPVTISLASDASTGRFATSREGSFDGTVTSVTIPAGESSSTVYYRDSVAAKVSLTATALALTQGVLALDVLESAAVEKGEVVIYTGTTLGIARELAEVQAQICADKLTGAGILTTWIQSEDGKEELADWVANRTGNGKLDVLVLYGDFPSSIYPEANSTPDGSLAELFLESTDGDAILNHAEYTFWGASSGNLEAGLQNMMDIPGIVQWGDDTPVLVTPEGHAIAPSLVDFHTDRPIFMNQLQDAWHPEAILAASGSGVRADPIILRDGNRGRLICSHQAYDQDDPKGAVGAEIIQWLFSKAGGESGRPVLHRGDSDSNGALQITDAIRILEYLFLGQGRIPCADAADADDNGAIELTDAVRILGVLFLGQGAIPPPGGTGEPCAADPTPDGIGCESYAGCE